MTKFDNSAELAYLDTLDYKLTEHGDLLLGAPIGRHGLVLTIDNASGKAKMFKRNLVRAPMRRRWLVGELNGVRVYCTEDNEVIMTDKDIYALPSYEKPKLEGEAL